MAVEVTKTYKVTCDSCGKVVPGRGDVRNIHIAVDDLRGVDADICLQCMDLQLSELLRRLRGTPAETDEERIRAAMAEAQDHPGRLVTR